MKTDQSKFLRRRARGTAGSTVRHCRPDIGSENVLPSVAFEAATLDQDQIESAPIARLQAAIRARDSFIGLVTHELRGPMAPIYSQVEFLQRIAESQGASEQLLRGIERLRTAVDNYVHRATTLLETTRLASGQRRLQTEWLNLSGLVRDVVENYQVLAARAGCPLLLEIEDDVTGVWDRLAIEQVMENLVSNALKYGRGSPITVRLACEPSCVQLVVSDQGPGILQQDQERIFAQFEQMAVGIERRGGFGIGLWVVRQLVESMHGSIELDSRAGQGATFTVRLPHAVRRTQANRGARVATQKAL